MADAFEAQVTSAIKTKLKAMTLLGETPTVEQERFYKNIQGRYPYIEISGPFCEYDMELDTISNKAIGFMVKVYVDHNDEDTTENNEITYITRNVNRDVLLAIRDDQTLGGLVTNIDVESTGYDTEIVNEDSAYFNYVEITANVVVDNDDIEIIE